MIRSLGEKFKLKVKSTAVGLSADVVIENSVWKSESEYVDDAE